MEDRHVEDVVKCSECGSRSLTRDETRGELVCDDCGLVLEDNVIDQGAEWRVFSPEQGDQRARTGAPMTVMLHDKGLSTDIDWQNKDYSGKTINSRYRSQFYRMRKWQKRSRVSNATERNLAMALAELDRMASRLELPKSVREAAAVNYKKAVPVRGLPSVWRAPDPRRDRPSEPHRPQGNRPHVPLHGPRTEDEDHAHRA